MNIAANLKLDKAAFARFLAAQPEGRFEYVRGRIVQQMTGGSLRHTLVAERFRDLLRLQLNEAEWLVTSQGRGVETAATIRHPDVVLEPAGADLSGLWTDRPSLIVEVLSPSTEQLDLNVKAAEYIQIASLQAYIAASQDEPACIVWHRRQRLGFAAKPRAVQGLHKSIRVPSLSIELPLVEIYRGIAS